MRTTRKRKSNPDADPEALSLLDDGSVCLSDLAERIEFLGPKVGKLMGCRVVRVDPNDPVAVSRAKAAIKDRHDSWAENRLDKTGAGDGTAVITVLRISELERYLRHRYGVVIYDDDAGREDFVILLNHVAHNRTDPGGKMLGFAQRWAPWMSPNESEALIATILAKPRKYSPKRLGELLRLTEAERRHLRITTIRAFNATDETMAENAKRKDRERQKAKRDEKRSGRPRGRPKSEGVPAWRAAGFSSERSYYRHKARRTTAAQSGSKNASEALEAYSYASYEFSLPPAPAVERGRPQAVPSHAPIIIDMDHDDVDDGDALMAPPWTHRTIDPHEGDRRQ
jgi:hypothetical protein